MPLPETGDQLRLICVDETAVATGPVGTLGAPGVVGGVTGTTGTPMACVVAFASEDGAEVPPFESDRTTK